MRKGRVIIDFESNELGDCKWDLMCEGPDKLDDENIKSLLEHVLGDLIAKEFQ